MNLTEEEIIYLLKSYNFIDYSIKSFSKLYNINPKIVRKYLIKYNIPYKN